MTNDVTIWKYCMNRRVSYKGVDLIGLMGAATNNSCCCYWKNKPKNIGGTLPWTSPLHKYWGDMSPLSHMDRRPWWANGHLQGRSPCWSILVNIVLPTCWKVNYLEQFCPVCPSTQHGQKTSILCMWLPRFLSLLMQLHRSFLSPICSISITCLFLVNCQPMAFYLGLLFSTKEAVWSLVKVGYCRVFSSYMNYIWWLRRTINISVPVLLLPRVQISMDILLTHCVSARISATNNYVFAYNKSDNHLRGSDALRNAAKSCCAESHKFSEACCNITSDP